MASGFHHPGRPEDLPPAPTLWAHGVLGAATAAAAPWEALHLYSLDDEGLLMDPEDGTWWRLTWFGEDTAVLTGNEPLGYRCQEYEGLVDKLAGAPEGLPLGWLRNLLDTTVQGSWEPSFLYWWTGGTWGRTAYPDELDDDGLCVVGTMGTPEGIQEHGCVGDPPLDAVSATMKAAATGTLTPSALDAFLRTCGVEDPAPALRVAIENGLTPDAPRPVLKVT